MGLPLPLPGAPSRGRGRLLVPPWGKGKLTSCDVNLLSPPTSQWGFRVPLKGTPGWRRTALAVPPPPPPKFIPDADHCLPGECFARHSPWLTASAMSGPPRGGTGVWTGAYHPGPLPPPNGCRVVPAGDHCSPDRLSLSRNSHPQGPRGPSRCGEEGDHKKWLPPPPFPLPCTEGWRLLCTKGGRGL